jgi:hypothetical protein
MVNDQATSDSESTEFARRRKRRSKGVEATTRTKATVADGSGTAAAVPVKEPVTKET